MDDYIKREAVIDWIDCVSDGYKYIETGVDFAKKDINAIPAATPAEVLPQMWVSVTERLPGKTGRYLCVYEPYHDLCACVDFGLFIVGEGWCVSGVTHWMPLPEPPKEEN